MDEDLLITIADALVTKINQDFGDTEGLQFTAQRAYLEEYPLNELDVLKVNVTLFEEQNSSQSRGAEEHLCTFNVIVQKRVDPEDLAQMDPLINLVGEISNSFLVDKTELMAGVLCVDKKRYPICNPKYLLTDRRFFSVLILAFRVWVDDPAEDD